MRFMLTTLEQTDVYAFINESNFRDKTKRTLLQKRKKEKKTPYTTSKLALSHAAQETSLAIPKQMH